MIVSPKAFGSRLRGVREKLGLTQAALAEACGVERGRISRLENGAAGWPALATLALICEATGKTPDELLLAGVAPGDGTSRRLVATYRRGFEDGAESVKAELRGAVERARTKPRRVPR